MRIHLFLTGIIGLLVSFGLKAQTVPIGSTTVALRTVISDLDTPWEILWGPDNHIWFTERKGTVNRLDPETGELQVLATIGDVHEESESGLLGMALHPDFEYTPFVYLVYTYLENTTIREKILRYEYASGTLINPEILLDNIPGYPTHDGSRMVFGPDGMLYFSTGDAHIDDAPQDTSQLNGKILRMTPEGEIPVDNPFAGSYVWTLGHRNPQGLVFSPAGILYSSEHGPSNDDEINIISKARNYGWPDVAGFCEGTLEQSFCTNYDVREPLVAWTPTLAVCGLDYYASEAIPEWTDHLLLTTLKEKELVSLALSADGMRITAEDSWLDDEYGRLRDLCIAPDGRVFIATSNRDGRGDPVEGDDRILEIRPFGIGLENEKFPGDQEDTPRLVPNPITETGQLYLPDAYHDGMVRLYTAAGRLVFEKKVAGRQMNIPKNQLPEGLYYLLISGKGRPVHIPVLITW